MHTITNDVKTVKEFNLEDTPKGTIQNYWLELTSDAFSNPISIPLIVARGMKDGPILGLTAAVHGNELNGIPIIQRLFSELDINDLTGSIVGVPVANIPSFMKKQRRFDDGVDLNHVMPGKPNGTVSQIYAFRFFDRLVQHFTYLLDLHTASFGRINSYYVRADMSNEVTRTLALLQNADLIVHNPPSDGTLRGAADEKGIPAITLEVGNPNTYQKLLIRNGLEGIHNVLCHFKMIDDEKISCEKDTIICNNSYWMYTDEGGLLTVQAALLEKLSKDQEVAIIRDIFGRKLNGYFAPENGVVIGKSISPVNQSGGRILHLGIEQ